MANEIGLKVWAVERKVNKETGEKEYTYQEGSQTFETLKILREYKRPMSIKEIAVIFKMDKEERSQLNINIATEVRKNRCFIRITPGIYGLKELENTY